jgi:hypothetical protein
MAVALSALTSACSYFVSWKDVSQSWVGRPVSEFIKLNGQPSTIAEAAGGEFEYRFDLKRLDASCVHWWLVDKGGTIVGYRYQGYCRPIG